jgi:putative addiction module component (TIGR02574 family)
MDSKLRDLSVDERIKLVEDLWDSIAADQNALPLTSEQKAELDRRLDAYALDRNRGRLAADVIAEIRRQSSIGVTANIASNSMRSAE